MIETRATASPEAADAAVNQAIGMAEFSPKRETLADLPGRGTPDPGELIRHRLLCLGGTLLLVAATGIGKSTLLVQLALYWTLGRALFGLVPVRPLRIWIVQAENDRHDLGEMRDGVCRSLAATGAVTDGDLQEAAGRIAVYTEDAVCGERFGAYLDAILTAAGAGKPDLVMVDPALAYFGGDINAQKELSPFLRNVLNPVLHRHSVGLVLCHHTNKPASLRGSNGPVPTPTTGDYAYLGAGGAELANWARAVLSIQEVRGAEGLYLLRAGKRGRRLGWTDRDGNTTCRRYIAHAREPDAIYWREPDPGEVPEEGDTARTGRPSKNPAEYIASAAGLVAGKPLSVGDLKAELQARYGVGEKLAQTVLTLALKRGNLAKVRVQLGPKAYDLVGLPGRVEQERDRLQEQFRSPELPQGPAK